MARSFAALFAERSSESSGPHFQSDADLSRIVFSEVNAGLLKRFLNFDDSGEIFLHYSLGLLACAGPTQYVGHPFAERGAVEHHRRGKVGGGHYSHGPALPQRSGLR